MFKGIFGNLNKGMDKKIILNQAYEHDQWTQTIGGWGHMLGERSIREKGYIVCKTFNNKEF